MNCPLCRSVDQLLVSLDTSLGGEWAYCRECKFAGDMIALASATWKLGILQTLQRLAAMVDGFPVDPVVFDSYIVRRHDRLARIRDFWQGCQVCHMKAENADLRALQKKFNSHNAAYDDWPQGVGQFIGSSCKDAVEATFQPIKSENWEGVKNKRSGSLPSTTLTGPNWKDLLVIPYWDLPGRMCGFLFIGRGGEIGTDFVYRPLYPKKLEGGLAMLPALLGPTHPQFGASKFVFTDVDIAIRFHTRNIRESLTMLPLAASWDDGRHCTASVWDWFKAKNLIFWGYDYLKTIKQARQANGLVSTLRVTRTEVDTNMRNLSPVEWLIRVRASTIPWATALQDYLGSVDDAAIAETLLQLDLQGRDLTVFAEGCSEQLRGRLQFVMTNKTLENKVLFENHWIVEKADGWYMVKGGARISNAVIHIDNVLTTVSKRSYYRGTVLFNGVRYPFVEKTTTLTRGALCWAQSFLRDQAKAGVSEYFPSWNKRAVQLAIMFSNPTYANGIDVIGWDAANRQFNFPRFAIQAGGNITTDFSCLFDNADVPGKELPLPGLVPRVHIDALSAGNDETQIFWAVAACVVANIVAPAVNRNQLPILLGGEGASGIGESAALRLGCAQLQTDGNGTPLPYELAATCSWPVVGGPLRSSRFGLLDRDEFRNGLFSVAEIAGKVLAIRGRVNFIAHKRKLGSLQLLHNAALYVIPNYIQDLYRRNIMLSNESPDLAIDVLHDMADWFSRLNGDPASVLLACDILYTPRSKPAYWYFCDLVFHLHAEGVLSSGESNYLEGIESIVQMDKNLIWISQDRFSDAVKMVGGVAPDIILISKSLEEAKALVSEPTHKHRHGWLIRADWWNEQHQTWRAE